MLQGIIRVYDYLWLQRGGEGSAKASLWGWKHWRDKGFEYIRVHILEEVSEHFYYKAMW